jgi:hypothetical protein
MSIAFIGCGLASKFRAGFLDKNLIKYCYDTDQDAQKKFMNIFDCKGFDGLNFPPEIKNVFIGTPHVYLYPRAKYCLQHGLNVCVEKPGAVNSSEIESLERLANELNVVCHIGYSISNTLYENYDFSDLIHLKGYYAHGARDKYDQEWRMQNINSGSGVHYDLLSHLIHFSLLINPNAEYTIGHLDNLYWQCNAPDYAQVTLKNNALFDLSANACEWKNRFDIYAIKKNSKIAINNLKSQTGYHDVTFFSSTGPGIVPIEKKIEQNINFWQYDTNIFINKILNKTKTNLFIENKTLQIIERLNSNYG